MAEVVAARLGWDEADVEVLRTGRGARTTSASSSCRSAILRKPGPLDEDELAEMRRHPEEGARMVARHPELQLASRPCSTTTSAGTEPATRSASRARRYPAEARVLAVVDAFDAMTTHRSYRRAMTEELAVTELERCAGTQFDPEIVRVFTEAWRDGLLADATHGLVRAVV